MLVFDLFCSVVLNKLFCVFGLIKFYVCEVRDNCLFSRVFMSIKGGSGCKCVCYILNVGEFMLL